MTTQLFNNSMIQPVLSNLLEEDEVDLDAILDDELAKMDLDFKSMQNTVTINSTTGSTPPIPDTSHINQQVQIMTPMIVKFLEEQVRGYQQDPIAFKNCLKEMFESFKGAVQSNGKEFIISCPSSNPNKGRKIKIFIDKLGETDIELFHSTMNEKLESQVLEQIEKLIREEKAIDVTYELSLQVTDDSSSQRTDDEMKFRVELLKNFGIDQELCKKMAQHDEFFLTISIALIHLFSENADIIPDCAKVLASQDMSEMMARQNPMDSLAILQKALSAERFAFIKQQYVSYLIKNLET